jgi:predicted nucleic acid-binding Zn ribbon protein
MPTYEYLCEANGRVMEVHHKMAEEVKSWGDLCLRAGVTPGTTNPEAPVKKLMSAGFIGGSSSGGESVCEPTSCGNAACGGGMCGMA